MIDRTKSFRQLCGGQRRRGGPDRPFERGDELARELGIKPGPGLGELLARLEEERFAGEVATRDEALSRARELLRQRHS